MMTNRLRSVLMSIISETQSAFLPGRIISDNILVAHEVLHYMNRNNKSKHASMAVKLDMSKAYDRVEWYFLEAIMLKLGFCRRWVDWTMCLVSTISYSFLINGALRGYVQPTRGIHQGDPLSSYFFLLCVERLTCMLLRAEERKALNGIKIARNCLSISHILFADDTVIFCRANVEEGAELMCILGEYELASSQKLI
ncbi:hypothetical protein LIER_32075 [Lithospermum erythrorhizon]|uniref:Reverse transcriptase domain-containing protein n=1 Tax=Lithospermum erythrorhizon TaxID=34254 RepID=A0AAV3RWU1_LITER